VRGGSTFPSIMGKENPQWACTPRSEETHADRALGKRSLPVGQEPSAYQTGAGKFSIDVGGLDIFVGEGWRIANP